tara:strand:- start:168 stop:533 length:366 start_codon:yes stop_codon:yes gene_type:complete
MASDQKMERYYALATTASRILDEQKINLSGLGDDETATKIAKFSASVIAFVKLANFKVARGWNEQLEAIEGKLTKFIDDTRDANKELAEEANRARKILEKAIEKFEKLIDEEEKIPIWKPE